MHWCPGGPRWFSSVVLIGSLSLTSLGCASATPKPPSLTGRWRAWFRLDTASRLPFAAQAREVTGQLYFRPAPPASLPQDARTWRLVHPGTVAVEFKPFGFALGTTEALGWYQGKDTVRIILDPTVDHGHVELVGSGAAEEIDGHWQLISDPARAEGEFRLHRLD